VTEELLISVYIYKQKTVFKGTFHNKSSGLEFTLWLSKISGCMDINWGGLTDGDGKRKLFVIY
jgi:hypothetical protein